MTTATKDGTGRRGRSPRRSREGVLHVITSTSRRGAEIFAVDLGEALAARGRAIRTVALVGGGGPDDLRVPTLGQNAFGPRTLWSLRREIRRARIAVAHGSSAVAATALATRGTRTPFIYRNIGDPSFWFDTPKRRRRLRWILRRARTTVALWEGSRDELRRIGGSDLDIRVIPKGVPASRFPPIDQETRGAARRRFSLEGSGLTAVFVGSLTSEKNVDAAIAAVALIPDARLLIVGSGVDQKRLADDAERLAPGRILFTGTLRDPAEALAASDVLILTSTTEGIPGVLIEAAFSELPVVATAVGGVPGIVVDGASGVLVPTADPELLASALRSVSKSARAMGKVGRRHCSALFEIELIADRWDSLLDELGAWNGDR